MIDPKLDRMGRSALHNAVIDKQRQLVSELLASGVDVNLKDSNGWTPLHFAAQDHSIAIAEMLLEAGAEIDAKDSHGNTPLSKAVFNYRDDGAMIHLLRARGADPFVSNNHGTSPVVLARRIANYDVAKFFSDLPK